MAITGSAPSNTAEKLEINIEFFAVRSKDRCYMMRTEVCNTLVFDGENLKIGFDGLTLI